jgi:outer membrane immunogenic protein
MYNWSGCYLGGQIGGQWGGWTAGVNYVAPGTTAVGTRALDAKGSFAGGIQLGCNYQPVASMFVVGVEGDLLAAKNTFDGEVYRFAAPLTDHFDGKGRIGNQASLRLRIGAAWDRLFVYAAGGATVATLDITHTLVRDGVGSSIFYNSSTRLGYNVGAGFEYALASGWTAGLEYRYTTYGSNDYVISSGVVPFPFVTHTANAENIHTNDVRFRLNYVFGSRAVVAKY